MSDMYSEEDWTGIIVADMPTAQVTTAPEPDMAIAEAFWNEVAPGEPIRLRFLNEWPGGAFGPRAIEREYPSVEAAWPEVVANQKAGYNTYYFANTPEMTHLDGANADALNVYQVRAFYADFDKGLPEQFHVEPNVIVYTSRTREGVQKAQALWLVNYPPRCTDRFDRSYAQNFKERARDLLAAYPTSDPATKDIVRVLRLPGSLHLKDPANPQLVTFEVRHSDGPLKPGMSKTAHHRLIDDVFAGVPHREHASAPKGEKQDSPVDVDHLRHLLGFVSPDCSREEWRDVIYAIRSTRLLSAIPTNIPGIIPPDDYETLLDVGLEWSHGELDHAGRYIDGPPLAYYGKEGKGGDDDIINLFEGADPDGDRTFGTIVHLAKEGGWRPRTPEEKKPAADDGLPSWVPHDVLRSGRHYAMLPRYYKDAPEFKFFDDDKVLPNNPDGAVALLYANYSNHKTNWAVAVSISLIQKKGLLVVYAAGEGDIDVGKLRVPAIASKAHSKAVEDFDDFVIVPSVPNLALDPSFGAQPKAKDREEFRKLLHEIERKHGRKIDIIWVDTLATATVGVEENSSEFGGLLTKSGPVGELAREFRALVIVIHHTGKDETRGARGSNALNCNIDALYECKYDHEHELLRLFVEKTKTTTPRFSTYYGLASGGWPVPIQISREVFEERGGTDADDKRGKGKKDKKQDSKAKDLRDWLKTQIEKWPTWTDGPSDAEVARLYLEAHDDPEPKSGNAEEHQEWLGRKKKQTQAFMDCHHRAKAEPGTARYLGDWKVEGKGENWRWRWFNNGYADPVSF